MALILSAVVRLLHLLETTLDMRNRNCCVTMASTFRSMLTSAAAAGAAAAAAAELCVSGAYVSFSHGRRQQKKKTSVRIVLLWLAENKNKDERYGARTQEVGYIRVTLATA